MYSGSEADSDESVLSSYDTQQWTDKHVPIMERLMNLEDGLKVKGNTQDRSIYFLNSFHDHM